MSVIELADELDIEFLSAKRGLKAKDMPTEEETNDLITSALTKAILNKLAENESLDINLVRQAVVEIFNKNMEPNYSVRSILQSNGTVTLRIEGHSTFDVEHLEDLRDDRD